MRFSFWIEDKPFELKVEEKQRNEILVSFGGEEYRVGAEFLNAKEVLLNIKGRVYDIIIDSNSSSYSVYVKGKFFLVERKTQLQAAEIRGSKSKKKEVRTSMPGKVIKVLVKEGERVEEGQPILVLEAMKMQNEIKSPGSGTITRINPKAGDSVETGALLFQVE